MCYYDIPFLLISDPGKFLRVFSKTNKMNKTILIGTHRNKVKQFLKQFKRFRLPESDSKNNSNAKKRKYRFIKRLSDTPMFENLRPFVFQTVDGKFFESIQHSAEAEDHSKVFTALKDENGNWVEDTLWAEEEMENAETSSSH